MRRHPDDLVGRYRLPDTAAIRRYFESNPAEFESALAEYRAWKWTSNRDQEVRQSRRQVVDGRARAAGADAYDWHCVLMCASRRRELGLSCPPWWEGGDQP